MEHKLVFTLDNGFPKKRVDPQIITQLVED